MSEDQEWCRSGGGKNPKTGEAMRLNWTWQGNGWQSCQSTERLGLDRYHRAGFIGCNIITIKTGQCGSNWEVELVFNPVQVDWRMGHR